MIAKEASKAEYNSRINRVIEYIDKNIDQALDLKTVADIAHFSPFHFHRIFTFLIGETPVDFIQRLRIEKSAHKLRDTTFNSITEIAYSCGFGSVSLFSRTFKKYFGITPSEFRNKEKAVFSKNGNFFSKNGQLLSKNLKNETDLNFDICKVKLKEFIIMETKIEVKELPALDVIYCRHIGPFCQIGNAFEKVIKWATPRKLYDPLYSKTVTVTHDDPSVTALEKIRQSACIIVDHDVQVSGEISKMTIPGGEYAVGNFELPHGSFENAWNTMCVWFTESGYQQGDGCTYELYHNDYSLHPEKLHIVDICIPVKPL